MRPGAAATVLALLAAAGCGDDSDNGDDADPAAATTAPTTTTTAQPSATDDEAAFAAVEGVVSRSSELHGWVQSSPDSIEDRIEELEELYTPGNEIPANLERRAQDLQEAEAFQRNVTGFSGQPQLFDLTTVDADTIRFQYCEAFESEVLSVDEELRDAASQLKLGVGEAHRVDGTWRLHTLTPRELTHLDPRSLQPDRL